MMPRPFVMFGEDWGGLPSSTQHLAKRFVQDRPVIWVNSIGLRRPKLSGSDLARAVRKVTRMVGGSSGTPNTVSTPVPKGLTVINPRAVSWPGSRLASTINNTLLGAQLRATLSRLNLERPVLWTSLPTAVDAVGTIGESAVVYYCCDDFESLAGVDHEPVGRLERQLVDRADLVFTTNDHLNRKLAPRNHEPLPHGVDVELFSKPAGRPSDLPRGKVALFYGSLSSWIDAALLAELSARRTDWDFVLIGSVQTDLSALRDRANVHLLGPRPHHTLPGYVQHADAALLPFRDIPQIRACNPLKLREYLASGTPIVSTDFPALAPYREMINVAEGAQGFGAALDTLDNGDAARTRRRLSVQSDSWEARADDALRAIDELTS